MLDQSDFLLNTKISKLIDEHISDSQYFNIEGENAARVAKNIADEQRQEWNNIVKILNESADLTDYIKEILSRQSFTRVAQSSPNNYNVRSLLPVIFKELRIETTSEMSHNVNISSSVIKLKIINSSRGMSNEPNFSVNSTLASLISEKNILIYETDRNNAHTNVTLAIKDLAEKTASLQNEAIKSEANHSKQIQIYKSEISEIKSHATEAITEIRKSAENEIENLRYAQKSLLSLAPTIDLWNRKAKNHFLAYVAAIFLFVFIIATSATYIVANADSYIPKIASIAPQNTVIISALLVTPLIAIGWILRLINKFASVNLQLYEDAVHRRANAATYIGLLGDTPKGIDEKERAVALQALFRPAPGSSSDSDINPPSIMDLFGKKD